MELGRLSLPGRGRQRFLGGSSEEAQRTYAIRKLTHARLRRLGDDAITVDNTPEAGQAPIRSHRPRRRVLVLAALLALLSPALYSYTATMLEPSSLPLSVRSVEWLRTHHGNWLVDEAEHVYYGWWKKPTKGGPQLQSLPVVLKPSAKLERTSAWPKRVPLVFRHALPGEGAWHQTAPGVLVTEFRTERDYPRIVAYVAWFDHRRVSIAWYPGRYEPPSAPVRGPIEVPQGQRWRLLATFNGGFIHIDGNNGSSIGGMQYEPLQRGLATLIAYRDGRVDVRSWTSGAVTGRDIAFARQSLPLIVDHGKLSPLLDNSTKWGFTLGDAVRVWRTGAGVDRRGNIIYAAADGQTVFTLARILQRAGAVRAMELDINPEWPTLITYAHHHGLDPTKIVPNYQQPATRYLVPDDRDFFAVYRRLPGPVTVPFR